MRIYFILVIYFLTQLFTTLGNAYVKKVIVLFGQDNRAISSLRLKQLFKRKLAPLRYRFK